MKEIISLALAAVLLTASLSACGSPSEEKLVDLDAFVQTVLESYEFPALDRLDPADEFGAVILENAYPGLKDMELEQIEIYLAPISFSGVELALVQARNAEDAARVKEIFDARVAAKTTEGPNNYPEEVKLWQRCAQVASNGSYVMLVAHEDSGAIVSEFNGLFS